MKTSKLTQLALSGILAAGVVSTAFAGDSKEKSGCEGKNGCKGMEKKEASATGASDAGHDCAGKNECKGLGGCKVAAKDGKKGHDCAGNNDCKGLGGCKVSAEKLKKLKEAKASKK